MLWTGKNDLKKLRVDVAFFENGEESAVFKNVRIRVGGAKNIEVRAVKMD